MCYKVYTILYVSYILGVAQNKSNMLLCKHQHLLTWLDSVLWLLWLFTGLPVATHISFARTLWVWACQKDSLGGLVVNNILQSLLVVHRPAGVGLSHGLWFCHWLTIQVQKTEKTSGDQRWKTKVRKKKIQTASQITLSMGSWRIVGLGTSVSHGFTNDCCCCSQRWFGQP